MISYSFLMYMLDILAFVSFRTCNKPLRKIDYLTLSVPCSRTESFKNLYGFVAHWMNYLLTSGSPTL